MPKIFKSYLFKSLVFVAFMTLLYMGSAHASVVQETPPKGPQFTIAPPEIQAMFEQIKQVANGDVSPVTLRIETNSIVNAYMDQNARLTLDVGLLNFAIRDNNDEGMIAAVMGHEMSHWILYHTRGRSGYCSSSYSAGRNCEREADINGIKLTADAGYDCNEGAKLFELMTVKWGDPGKDPYSDHPSFKERITYIHKACRLYQTTGQLMPYPKEKEVPDPPESQLISTHDHNIDLPELQ